VAKSAEQVVAEAPPDARLAPASETSGGPDGTAEVDSTRSRILDVALDLFVEKGYDRTSLREIAERLGVTKAAIYYYFSSKDDILMALHMRLHEVGREALGRLARGPVSVALWADLLDEVMGEMLAQRSLFLLHERNQAALEKLHGTQHGIVHDAEHEDLQQAFHRVLADKSVPLRDRIRMACSFGAVFACLFMAGDAFADVSDDDLGDQVRSAVRDLLGV